ncbi:cyclin-L2-like [Planococcus citri]|uniref:cyclin-L2-like n=1 Tax=Planococcus citri TaxID=170843 RepID=UPI0031F7C2E3
MGSQKNESVNPTIAADAKTTPVYGKVILSLENCLLSPEKLEKSPSVNDGLDPETEFDLRVIGCELIQTAGILLKLPQVAMATGQVLFQRFYYCRSFVRHPMDVTAMGCVYLASKIEEAPRRVRDVINVFHHIRQVRCQKPIAPLILDEAYIKLKEDVIRAERRILKELGFCVHVKHPHKLIVMYLQILNFAENKLLMQKAWNYMNDSLRTEVFLRYSPETVACACIYLSARVLRIPLPKSPSWFVIFGVKEEDIIDVCRRIVNLYSREKIDPDVLEGRVKLLRDKYKEEKEKKDKIRNNNAVVSGSNTPNSTSSITVPLKTSPSPPAPTKIITTTTTTTTTTNHLGKRRSRSRSRGRSPSPKKKSKKYSRKYDSPNDRKRDISPISKKYSSSSPSTKKHRDISPVSKKYLNSSSPVSRKYTSTNNSSPPLTSKKYASSPVHSSGDRDRERSRDRRKYASSDSPPVRSSKKYTTGDSPSVKRSKKYTSTDSPPVRRSKKYANSRDTSPISSKKYDLSPIYTKKYYSNGSPVSKLSSYYNKKDYRVKNHTYKKKRKD